MSDLYGDSGDVDESGDIEIGDLPEYGEADLMEAGDIEFGDAVNAFEQGAPMSRRGLGLLSAALGATTLGVGGYALAKSVQAKRERRRKQAAQALVKQSVSKGKDKGFTSRLQAPFPFLGFDNCRVQISPLGDPMRAFPLKLLASALDRTEQDSPTTAVTKTVAANGVGVAATTFGAADITVQAMLVPYFVIEFAAPTLSALPAGIINITQLTVSSPYLGTLNLLAQGNVTIAVAGITNRVAIMVTPWNLVNSWPQPTLGVIGSIPIIAGGIPAASVSQIAVTATGLPPSVSFMNLIIPGSSHLITQRVRAFISMAKMPAQKSLTNLILGGL